VKNPKRFAEVFLKIQDKNKKLIPLRWNKAQEHFHINRTGRDLILKARQLGFSTLIQGEMFRRTITSPRTTMTLAHDADTTALLRLMSDRFYDHCRFGDIQPARKYANASLTTYPEFDSAATIATAGNLQSGRGGTFSDFHGSEVAFWKDAEKLIAGAMQGGNPDVVLESTPNGAQGYFYERCMEALHGEGIWKLHFYPWWWDDTYRIPLDEGEQITPNDEETLLIDSLQNRVSFSPEQLKWRRYKKQELGRLFTQEYPEDPVTCFLTSGDSFFGDLSEVFTAPLNPLYNEDHEYFAGLDFGQTSDFTAMIILDKTTKTQVDLLHIRRLSWAEQRRRIREMYKKWRCSAVGAEKNSIGSVNIEALLDDGLRVIPFDTTNQSKYDIMTRLYEGIHTGGWRLQGHSVLRQEMQTFVTAQQTASGLWRLAADGSGHDDTVMSLAIAKWTVDMAVRMPEKQPTQRSKWIDSEQVGWTKKY